jgi:hypothetical protein
MFFCSFFLNALILLGLYVFYPEELEVKIDEEEEKVNRIKKYKLCVCIWKKNMILKYEKIAINWYLNALSFENI